ncbi:hypothetical protein JCM19037_4659 [Geomicrobium sp. JCM 19037]|uniref:hypothetical protein n=1 Tax=Geomicrobium sp. JCM 19037 TaxID=1460634 RepID=UPI00045F46EE|nr:hypothetical protein [Geomicrobium sp. JCM 19037]GAK06098.1 hypothetical protein JCM19037_4659 [Geomicrobium sp. JCM 19037]
MWESLPDAIQGLLKGLVAGLIAAVALVAVAALLAVSAKVILIAAAVALVAAGIYGLIVGGENFNWLHGILAGAAGFLSVIGAVSLAGTGFAAFLGQMARGLAPRSWAY